MSESMFKVEAPRPEATEADKVLLSSASMAVGELRAGHVIVLSKEIGTGYVQDDKTGVRFAIARKFLPDFDSLAEGKAIQFYENGRNAVAKIV